MLILDISDTSIADSIPDWFWSTFSKTEYLILSRNQIDYRYTTGGEVGKNGSKSNGFQYEPFGRWPVKVF